MRRPRTQRARPGPQAPNNPGSKANIFGLSILELMAEEKTNSDAEALPANTKPEGVPAEIPVLPLQNTTLFPETMVPLAAGRPASIAAVEAALSSEEKLLACVSVRPDHTSDGDADPEHLFEIGTLVMIKRMERVEDTLHLIVQGSDRIRVLEWTQR